MFKKVLATLLISGAAIAHADYRFIVPQEPGAGTSIWAGVVARELEKKLGEKIVIEHIPGARDIPGTNKFQNELRFDNKTVMVSHGGNAESFLVEKVDYKYKNWDPIGLQNLSIVVGYKKDTDPFKEIRFAAGSGNNPDAMAMTMLICGPMASMQAYAECYRSKFKFVNGMKAPERRLAYMRGELTAQRETPVAWNKFYANMDNSVTWFSHGILDIKTGKTMTDANYPGKGSFQEVYKAKWGVEPKSDLYDSYMLVKSYRDVLQKALWVNKGNPNTEKLRTALTEMLADKEAMGRINELAGNYPWLVGNDAYKATDALNKLTTRKALKDLVWWSSTVFGTEAFYKDDIAMK
jgi:hypothetical protein